MDARAQAGIQQVQAKAAEVDQKAQVAADSKPPRHKPALTAATHRVDTLQTTVANLDNYHVVSETAVHFGFNKDNLTKDAKEELDKMATNVESTKGYLITVEGATDSVGNADYNYGLSQRRADSVIQYLAAGAQYSCPQNFLDWIGQGQAGREQQDS